MAERMGAFDIFNFVLGNANQLLGDVASFSAQQNQRRRTSKYTDMVTSYRSRMNDSLRELEQLDDGESWDSIGERYSQAAQGVYEEIGEMAQGDEVLLESFEQFRLQEQENYRQRALTLQEGRRRAESMSRYHQEVESVQGLPWAEQRAILETRIEGMVRSGVMAEDAGTLELQRQEDRILRGQAGDILNQEYQSLGYEGAANWIESQQVLTGPGREDLRRQLANLHSNTLQQEERARRERYDAVGTGVLSGEITSTQTILDANLGADDTARLMGWLEARTAALESPGAAEPTENGRQFLARMAETADRGNSETLELQAEINEAYAAEMITRTERDEILERVSNPFSHMTRVWNVFDETMEVLSEAGASVSVREIDRRRADLVDRLRREVYTVDGGRWTLRAGATDEDVQLLVDNWRRETTGEKIVRAMRPTEDLSRVMYRIGDTGLFSGGANAGERNLLAIDNGLLRGYDEDDRYRPMLQEMSFGHKSMLEAVARAEGSPIEIRSDEPFLGFDRDGRPVFDAFTPVGRQQVAFRMSDPVTGEQFPNERLYYWDVDVEQWFPVPDGPPQYSSAQGVAPGVQRQMDAPRARPTQ